MATSIRNLYLRMGWGLGRGCGSAGLRKGVGGFMLCSDVFSLLFDTHFSRVFLEVMFLHF